MGNNISLNHSTCFVCIFRQPKPARILIVYGVDWNSMLQRVANDAELLFIRTFDHVLEGMGYKIMLEQLPPEDLHEVIHSVNAAERNLRPLIEVLVCNQGEV